MRKIIVIFFVLAVIAGISAAALLGFAYYSLQTSVHHETATFAIEKGTPLIMISEQLSRAGVINNSTLFALYTRLTRADRRIKAGEYEFTDGLSARDILRMLVNGECKLYKITLIEGWTIQQMADYLSAQPFAFPSFKDAFVGAAHDKFFVRSLGIDADSLEGFLFPNTYFIERPRTAEWLLTRLVSEFNKIWTLEFDARTQELGQTRYKIVTLASIIEKETGADAERPMVASVFYNRIKKGMLLQTDPTVIYGLKDYNGNITRADLSNPHAYNTYVHAGLPPGPISNPGLASIKAALWPAQTDYLYFVSKNDGTHQFSKTLAEHSQAVNKFQKHK